MLLQGLCFREKQEEAAGWVPSSRAFLSSTAATASVRVHLHGGTREEREAERAFKGDR